MMVNFKLGTNNYEKDVCQLQCIWPKLPQVSCTCSSVEERLTGVQKIIGLE